MGGLFFPVSLYPPLAQHIVMLTPFPAVLYIPASMMLGISGAAMLDGILRQLFWVLVLGVVVVGMEYRLVRRVMRLGD